MFSPTFLLSFIQNREINLLSALTPNCQKLILEPSKRCWHFKWWLLKTVFVPKVSIPNRTGNMYFKSEWSQEFWNYFRWMLFSLVWNRIRMSTSSCLFLLYSCSLNLDKPQSIGHTLLLHDPSMYADYVLLTATMFNHLSHKMDDFATVLHLSDGFTLYPQ